MFARGRFANFSRLKYADDKKEVARMFKDSKLTYTEFCARHSMQRGTLAGYMKKLNLLDSEKIDLFNDGDKGGKPKYLDSMAILDLKDRIRANTQGKAQLNKSHVIKKEFVIAHNAMRARRGLATDSNNVSSDTFIRICKEENLHAAAAQTVTHARLTEQEDPRNFFSFGAMCHAMIGMLGLVACMVMNWDATQFVITPDGIMRVIKCKDEFNKVASIESKGTLPFAVKWYWLHNAAGNTAKPVLCIADDSLSENAFEVHQVFGMGVTQDPSDFGWLVITKTRNCNDKFYDWFADNVVLDFIDKIRTATNLPLGADGKPMHCFIACDGEYIQIKAFQSGRILEQLAVRDIHLGKSPASLSHATQSSDKSMMFKASKKRLKFIEATDYKDDQLRFNLVFIFDNRRQQGSATAMTTAKVAQFVDGIQRVMYAIKTTLTPEIVKQGYRDIGMWPLDFRLTLSNCTRQISLIQQTTMEDRLVDGAMLMGTNGEITESDMDGMSIINVNTGKDKDSRAMHRMRAVVMNDPHMVTKWKNYTDARKVQLDAQAARAIVTANPNVQAERAALREHRIAEKARRDSMTAEERNAEASAKRKATLALKRAAKAAAEAAQAAAAAIANPQPRLQQLPVQAAILEQLEQGGNDDDSIRSEATSLFDPDEMADFLGEEDLEDNGDQ